MKKILFKDRFEWRSWLEKNHDKASELWLVYYKVKVDKVSIKYEEAVEEALCFGWIDSVVRRIDDEKHMQRFTPRKDKSNWSVLNKKRIEKLIQEDLMREPGLKKIKTAKENGSWSRVDGAYIKINVQKDAFDLNNNANE